VEIVRASATWSQDVDRYCLWAEPPASSFVPEPFDDDPAAVLLLELDEAGRDTGRIAGVEIALLSFDRWETVPRLPLLWQLPQQEPLPLDELLQREQQALRQRSRVAAHA